MIDIFFKKEFRKGLYNYLHISAPCSGEAFSENQTEAIFYNYQFNYYISLAAFLIPHLNKYIIIKSSPFLITQDYLKRVAHTDWYYHVLTDDFDGLGIDKGFMKTCADDPGQYVLFSADSLSVLANIPEDAFGDDFSTITIFALPESRKGLLVKDLSSGEKPSIYKILGENGVFINIICSKKTGYYNSMLIKCAADIESGLYTYQTTIDPNN